jgi:hypothetical protein
MNPTASGFLAAWIVFLVLFDLGLYCEWPAVWVTQQARTVEWFAENGGLRRENGECFHRELRAHGGRKTDAPTRYGWPSCASAGCGGPASCRRR